MSLSGHESFRARDIEAGQEPKVLVCLLAQLRPWKAWLRSKVVAAWCCWPRGIWQRRGFSAGACDRSNKVVPSRLGNLRPWILPPSSENVSRRLRLCRGFVSRLKKTFCLLEPERGSFCQEAGGVHARSLLLRRQVCRHLLSQKQLSCQLPGSLPVARPAPWTRRHLQ